MLHASETWPLTKTNLQRNDMAMIRQIFQATVRSSELLAKLQLELQLEDLDLILRERGLRWFGHVDGSSGAVRTACDIQIEGRGEVGAELTRKELTEKDCRE